MTDAPIYPSSTEDARSGDWNQLGVILLICFAAVTCFAALGEGPAMGDHECINAQSARESIAFGRLLIPQNNGIPWIRKTPLGIWLIAAASYLDKQTNSVPVTNYSARLPSAVAGMGNVLIVCWLGSMLFGFRRGLVAGFIAASCVATIFFARNAQVDMVLTLFTTLSFACFWRGAMLPAGRKYMVGFYIALAMAMMAKAPLPLVIVGVSLAVYWFVTEPWLTAADADKRSGSAIGTFFQAVGHQIRSLSRLWLVPGIVLFIILAGIWPFYVFMHVPNAVELWRAEYLDRYTGELGHQNRSFGYYWWLLLGMVAPFTLSLPEAFIATFLPRYHRDRQGLAFVLTWALTGTIFLSTAGYKRPHYLLSVMPAYCLLLAPVVDRLFFGALSISSKAVRAVCLITPFGIIAAAVAGSRIVRRDFPELLNMYVVVCACAVLLWSVACLAYAANRRAVSFALLNLGVMVIVLLAWPAAGKANPSNPEIDALATNLKAKGVFPGTELLWVGDRPHGGIDFYTGYRTKRLMNEIEIAGMRKGRVTITSEMYKEMARRIRRALQSSEPVYLVMASGDYELMLRETDIRPRVLFELTGYHEKPGEELIAITQALKTTTAPVTTRAGEP